MSLESSNAHVIFQKLGISWAKMEGNITSTYKFNMFRCDVHFLHKAEEENRQDMVDNVAKLGDPKEKSAMPSISATTRSKKYELWYLLWESQDPLSSSSFPNSQKKFWLMNTTRNTLYAMI